jgi:hypothetical protein
VTSVALGHKAEELDGERGAVAAGGGGRKAVAGAGVVALQQSVE